MKITRKIAIAASALAAFTGIVLISNQANATDVTPVPSPTVSSQSVATVTPSVDAPEVGSNAPDGDNVQSGDQTGPETAGTADTESSN